MIVTTRPRPESELAKAVRLLKANYKRAQEQNARRPGFIRKPISWALYQTWRETDGKTT